MEALHTTTLWTWWCPEKETAKKQLPKKSTHPKHLDSCTPQSLNMLHSLQANGFQWFPSERQRLSLQSLPCLLPSRQALHATVGRLPSCTGSKSQGKSQGFPWVWLLWIHKARRLKTSAKQFLIFFSKTSRKWPMEAPHVENCNYFQLFILFCLFEQFEPEFSIHAPPMHRASGTSVSLDLRK